ncbi:helix-turn-helix domain-containing protein [Aquabacterium sp. A7-Y]|uniref:helix-turn-helix domain-containing protein n=1 Tax=Aquabacterium sp. A7-Y TaxID=1349605 RepID=UPI0039FD2F82
MPARSKELPSLQTWKPTALAKAFGAVVRNERQRQGMTRLDLAVRSGMKPRYLGRLERGECVPGLPTITALAAALERPLDTLIGMVEDQVAAGRCAPEDVK